MPDDLYGPLEKHSLWYKYKTKVWGEDSPQSAVVHNAMRILRSIQNIGDIAYASAPVTTGKKYYEKLFSHKMLKSEALEKAIEENYMDGYLFVRNLIERLDIPVINPGDLAPTRQEWEQDHFMALWLSIIAEKCTEHHMSDEWEYSIGCAQEFVHTYQLRLGMPRHKHIPFWNTKEHKESEKERMRNIQVYDAQGNPISLKDGYEAIKEALGYIHEHDYHAPTLVRCLELLDWTGDMIEKGFYQ